MYSTSKNNEYMGAFIDYLTNTIPKFDAKLHSQPGRKKKSADVSETSNSKKQPRKRTSKTDNDPKKKTPTINCEIVLESDPSIDIKDEPLRLKEEIEDDNAQICVSPDSEVDNAQICVSPDSEDDNVQICVSPDSDNMDLTIVIADDEDEEISIIEPNDSSETKEMIHDLYNISQCGPSCSRYNKSNAPFIEKCPLHISDRGVYNKIFCAPKITDDVFFNYCRILPYQFNNLYNIVSSELWEMAPKKINKKNFVHPRVELALTLTFLTQGFTFARLVREFCINYASVSEIIPKVCGAICSSLESVYLPKKKVHDWLEVADEFWKKKLFPHTAGTFDGKILLQQGCGDSVLMLICCDVNYNILWASFCKYDTDQLKKCTFFQLLRDQMESLPLISANSNLSMPHFFVGAQKMPLMVSLMTPYRTNELTPMQRNFNGRLSDITDIVDETFVMLANRFWLYKRHFSCPVESIMIAMRATVSLHNFLRRTGADIRCPLNVETKLSAINRFLGHKELCEQAISNRKKLAQFLDPQKEIILIEEEDSDVIIIE